jgi:DNA recombination protein RmuC
MQKDSLKALLFELMEKNNRLFLDMAGGYFEKYEKSAKSDLEKRQDSIERSLNPIRDTLDKLEKHSSEIEKKRIFSYSALSKQLDSLIQSENLLRSETNNLVKALKSPNVRGAWGQIHLRRVLEISGLLNHCDFFEQKTKEVDGKSYRPDLVVKLPGNRQIVIDAKTPIDSYLESVDIADELRKREKLQKHAKSLKQHMKDLSEKKYWKYFSPSPEYVILFLPAEAFFSAALQEDPSLLEMGARKDIIIATPTTLIAILRAIAYSWKQEDISKNAEEIAVLGGELYERLKVMSGHWQRVGKSLKGSIDSYNKAISSLESRVLVSARKLKELGVSREGDESLEKISKAEVIK